MRKPDNYIDNEGVKREKIALDIKYAPFSKQELEDLISDERIQSAYIGTNYNCKKPKSEWTEDYLNLLSYAAVAESFNDDYIRYLNEVSSYVNEKKITDRRVKMLLSGILAGGMTMLAASRLWLRYKKKQMRNKTNS